MNHVLLATHDIVLERTLQVALTMNGLSVKTVSSSDEALECLTSNTFNLVLLDADFSQMGKVLRERGLDVPLLIFSEASQELELKDIHFIAKPFGFVELKKRMNKIFRARSTFKEKLIMYGDLKIDVPNRLVTIKDRIVSLGKMEMAILVSLARKTGCIVSSEKMRKDLAAQGHFFSSSIFHHIKELKRKLDHESGDTLKVNHVPGEGYRLMMG